MHRADTLYAAVGLKLFSTPDFQIALIPLCEEYHHFNVMNIRLKPPATWLKPIFSSFILNLVLNLDSSVTAAYYGALTACSGSW